jgi:hypothetical protein
MVRTVHLVVERRDLARLEARVGHGVTTTVCPFNKLLFHQARRGTRRRRRAAQDVAR